MDQTKADPLKQPIKTDSPNPNLNTSTNNPISRKLNKILESRIENDKV